MVLSFGVGVDGFVYEGFNARSRGLECLTCWE